ncbi:MAG: mechanosensitive ion channel family protein, partial [Lachnospiraceae bacterium]|nr:mechanosensitive ion channel family protein [Lachnospiraceae bacterium]
IEGTLYYYAALQSRIYRHVTIYAVAVAAGAFVLLILLAMYILHGYKKFFEEWSEIGTVLKDNGNVVRLSGGKRKYSVDPSRRWKENMEEYGIYAPFHTAFAVLENLLAVCILITGISVVTSGTDDNSLITFIISGQWTKGRNLFAFTSIMMLAAEVILSVKIIKMLLHLISQAFGTKGDTICRLLINLTGYVGAIAFVYFSLYNLGFRPDTLLASLGLLSFAVSLGAKDLITDVIAGLSIVFEGVYQVGDIIEVSGYRGEVLEIGVRSTKIEGRGGNIKIMNNRDVKNVVNMTRLNSWYPLDISISGDQPLGEVERLLTEQLPLIGKRIPEVISGPYYKGVVAIGKGVVTISIITECGESNYHVVQREVNRAVHDLFEDHGIQIL